MSYELQTKNHEQRDKRNNIEIPPIHLLPFDVLTSELSSLDFQILNSQLSTEFISPPTSTFPATTQRNDGGAI